MSENPPEPSPDDLLTSGDVAKMFFVHTKTVALWAKRGLIPSTQTPGGHYRYRRGDAEALFNRDEPK